MLKGECLPRLRFRLPSHIPSVLQMFILRPEQSFKQVVCGRIVANEGRNTIYIQIKLSFNSIQFLWLGREPQLLEQKEALITDTLV